MGRRILGDDAAETSPHYNAVAIYNLKKEEINELKTPEQKGRLHTGQITAHNKHPADSTFG